MDEFDFGDFSFLIPEEKVPYKEPEEEEMDSTSEEDDEEEDGEVETELWNVFVQRGIFTGIDFPEEGEEVDKDDNFECELSSEEESDDEDDTSEDEDNSTTSTSEQYQVVATYANVEDDDEESDDDNNNEENEEGLVGEPNPNPCLDWLKAMNIDVKKPKIEVITIDEEDEDDVQGPLQCFRCAEDQCHFKDKTIFLLHRERHKGRNHFVCPTCLKPFVKIGFCFAHEIRKHGMNFDFHIHNPVLTAAMEYRKKKEAEKLKQATTDQNQQQDPIPGSSTSKEENESVSNSDDELDPEFFDEYEPPPLKITKNENVVKNENCTNFVGLILFPEEGTYETDEDDPKFYPDHMVPSTALYPYRGPEPYNLYDCYAIQLMCSRNHRTNVNTHARSVQARRRRLAQEGMIAEYDQGRFWNLVPPPKPVNPPVRRDRRRGTKRRRNEDPMSDKERVGSNKRKRRVISSESEEESSGQTKRRKVLKKRPITNTEHRAFVAGVMARTCLRCGFQWKNEAELKAHRDTSHPNLTLLKLMTVVEASSATAKKARAPNTKASEKSEMSKNKNKKQRRIRITPTPPSPSPKSPPHPVDDPEPEEEGLTDKEKFLLKFNLVTIERAQQIRAKKPWPRGKVHGLCIKKLPDEILEWAKIWSCKDCDYYDFRRNGVRDHRRETHKVKAKKKDKGKDTAYKPNRAPKKANTIAGSRLLLPVPKPSSPTPTNATATGIRIVSTVSKSIFPKPYQSSSNSSHDSVSRCLPFQSKTAKKSTNVVATISMPIPFNNSNNNLTNNDDKNKTKLVAKKTPSARRLFIKD